MAEGVEHALVGDHAVGARELFTRLVEFIRHGYFLWLQPQTAYSMELIGSTSIDPCPPGRREFLVSRKKKNTMSIADMFWSFVEDNPKLAAKLAFELGSLAGTAVKNSVGAKKYLKKQAKNVPQAISDAMPLSLASALKFLPAPKLQPRKRPQARRALRKAKHATE